MFVILKYCMVIVALFYYNKCILFVAKLYFLIVLKWVHLIYSTKNTKKADF